LITAVVLITDLYDVILTQYGHTYSFATAETSADDQGDDAEALINDDGLHLFMDGEKLSEEKIYDNPKALNQNSRFLAAKKAVAGFVTSGRKKMPDLDELIVLDQKLEAPIKAIATWIANIYRSSRGVDLGNFSASLLSSAFREQSAAWAGITEVYISRIILNIHRLIVCALEVVCPDPEVRGEITSTIMPGLLKRYQKGMKKAMSLVEFERQTKPYTLNHYFNNNLQKLPGRRVSELLRKHARNENNDSNEKLVVDFDR